MGDGSRFQTRAGDSQVVLGGGEQVRKRGWEIVARGRKFDLHLRRARAFLTTEAQTPL